MNPGKIICIEGIIGAGKTSFGEEIVRLAPPGSVELLKEPDEKNGKNPYLSNFYEDPARWAFTIQAHLLLARHSMFTEASKIASETGRNVFIDRSIQGDKCFARLQLRRGHMSEKEFGTYTHMYNMMVNDVHDPDMMINLKVSPEVSLGRIQKRMREQEGRKCEVGIEYGYLAMLSEEIDMLFEELSSSGITTYEVNWDRDLDTDEKRSAIERMATDLNLY